MSLYALILAAALVVGCSSNDDESLQEDSLENTDQILDRTWELTAVRDSLGNQTPVLQEADPLFEFTIRLASSFVPPGGDVMQEVMSVGGMNVCNAYGGGYILENGLLTLISVSEDAGGCERASEFPATIFGTVLFGSDNTSMLAINVENDVLTIASGTNEALYFEVQSD